MNPILRAFSAVVDDVNPAERTIVAKVSAGDLDRYNTVIESRGLDLTAYRKNPVVLFEHGKDPIRGALPIGRNVWIRSDTVGNGRILAKTQFSKDSFSDQLLEFYRDGTMCGWSIRAIPKSSSPPSRDEIRSRPELADCEMIYRQCELGEYSAVSVPGLASALSEPELRSLSTLVVRGFWSPSEEIKPLVDPIIERMSESEGMASGGALVDDDEDEEDDDEDEDEKDDEGGSKKKKKKKKKAEPDSESDDDETRDAADGDPVEMCAEETKMRSMDDASDAETDSDVVERSTPESEAVATDDDDALDPEVKTVIAMLRDGSLTVNDIRRAAQVDRPVVEPAVESAPEPTPEPAPVDPLAGLPPLVGRSYEQVMRKHIALIAAWQKSAESMIREDFAGWLRGEG